MKIVDIERIPQAAENPEGLDVVNFKKLRQDDCCWKYLKIDFVELFEVLSAKGEFFYFYNLPELLKS